MHQHNIPFRTCGAMFLFIPVGMLMAIVLYPRLTELFVRLPFPGIEPKGQKLDEVEQRLKVVIPAWYAIYFCFWLSRGDHYCQCCHANIITLAGVVCNIETIITPAPHSFL